jgi:predicted phage terminase large subunit-like protein
MLDIQEVLEKIRHLPDAERLVVLRDLEILQEKTLTQKAQLHFLDFVRLMWPSFIAGRHHSKMADAFERVARGELKRLIINMPPRHTKSEFASYLFPAWFLGKFPHKKIIQTAHTAELAVGFGRKVRNLIGGEDFQKVFSGISLSSDSKAAGRWNTNKSGDYFAIGIGGAVTGKGADVLVIDDPHSEQEAQLGEFNPEVYDKVYEWYTSGPRQRLQPGGAIIIVMTRWSKRDLTGQILKKSMERKGSDEWEVIEFPAIMPSGTPLWPEFWSIEELEAIKAEIPVSKWNAQYMQDPTSEEGALIKREWWKEWPHDRPPNVSAIIQSWDTAFLKTQRSDYSACTTWGIFEHENEDGVIVPNLILLDAFKDKMEFPELKRLAHQKYWEYEPDQLVVEKKASGAPLIAELRMMGIPVTEFTPVRGNDKIARANAVTDLFASGIVWAPQTRWAEEVIEECASFPAGEHDDYVDSCLAGETLVLMADGTQKRIDMVRVGDMVATPRGPRRVIRFLDQGIKEVWKLETSQSHILATADHLVMTDRGWTRVDNLSPQVDTVTQSATGDMSWRSKAAALPRRLLSSTVGVTIGILKAKIRPIGDTSPAQVTGFTGMFGSFTTAQSQTAMKFTISMETPETTTYRTLSASQWRSTGLTTSQACLVAPSSNTTSSILQLFDHLRRHGTLLRREGLGTESTPKALSLLRALLSLKTDFLKSMSCVSGVAQNMSGEPKGASFAPSHVKQQKAGSGLVRAVTNTRTMRRVYDLEVDGEHCFYANGILVHNCTQALIRFRQGGWLRTTMDEWQEEPGYRRPVEYY